MTVSLAITIDQPYPALIVAGVKRFETRGNPPAGEMCPPGVRPLPGCRINRGERIAIHASARRPAAGMRLGLDHPVTTAEWLVDDSRARLLDLCNEEALPLPTSAIVATVRVVDALPIIDAEHGWQGDGDTPDRAIIVEADGSLSWLNGVDCWGKLCERDISDQLPYGYWNPGGWAWELDDVEPIASSIPCKGSQGVWRLPADTVRQLQEARP